MNLHQNLGSGTRHNQLGFGDDLHFLRGQTKNQYALHSALECANSKYWDKTVSAQQLMALYLLRVLTLKWFSVDKTLVF